MSGTSIEAGTEPTIVVVEDEAVVLAGYQMLFESWNYRVVAAQSADEAMEQLRAESATPSFILADFRLGGGATGLDAIARLRDAFGRSIPGVVVTGDTTVTVSSLRKAVSDGMKVLHKPVQPAQLREVLTGFLGRA